MKIGPVQDGNNIRIEQSPSDWIAELNWIDYQIHV